MFKKTVPFVILTLILGILSGCGSSNPYVEEARSNLQAENYTAALESAEQSIENLPQDPTGYYYKAVILGQLAQEQQDPAEAADYFKKMNEAFEQARQVAAKMEDEPPSEIERIEVVKSTFWRTEHNTAIDYATDDSLRNVTANPTQRAIQHLKNATIIRPDSVLSWNVLSQVYAMDQDFNNAIEAKKMVMEKKENPDAKDYLELGQYYRLASQPQPAVDILAKGHEIYPNEVGIIENLADAYNVAGQSEKAIETIQKLVEIDPANATYRVSMGTQIYQQALPISDSLSVNFETIFNLQRKLRNASGSSARQLENQISQLRSVNNDLRSRMNDLVQQANTQLEKAISLDTTNFNAYNTLGIIHQNEGATYFEERNVTDDNQMAQNLDKKGRDHLKLAMEYYEEAAEIRPDATDVWKSLFSIYTTLGMDQKAREAMKKAGIQ